MKFKNKTLDFPLAIAQTLHCALKNHALFYQFLNTNWHEITISSVRQNQLEKTA